MTLANLEREGVARPPQFDDTPDVLAHWQAQSTARASESRRAYSSLQLHVGYAAAGFATALLNNVFILYHVKLYTSVYAVSDAWLYAAFTVYGVWNTLNDPLFGWVEDRMAGGSLASSLQRRLTALRIGGVGLSLSFVALFTPWWGVGEGAPSPAAWLVGAHMVVCMSCYDAALTWVCQAHNALLAELTTDNAARATLGRYSSTAMMAGSASALAAFYAWNTLPFWGYQFVCVVVAAVAAVAFELSFQLLKLTAGESKRQQQEEPHKNAKSGGSGGSGWWRETMEFVQFAREASHSRSLSIFLAFGLCQQLNCTFNTSFFPLMVEILLSTQLPGWVTTMVLLTSFVLPHGLTMLATKLAARLQECYPIIRVLSLMKLGNCGMLLMGSFVAPLEPNCSWVILFVMIANRNVTECGCRLSALVMADVIDEDRVLHHRAKPMSSSIAGLHAIASKPGQSLAPVLGWYVLRAAGYTGGAAAAAAAATPSVMAPGLDEHKVASAQAGGADVISAAPQIGGPPPPARPPGYSALLGLLMFLPGIVGLVQVVLWQFYSLHGQRLLDIKSQLKAMDAAATSSNESV